MQVYNTVKTAYKWGMKSIFFAFTAGFITCFALGGAFMVLKTQMGWDIFQIGGYHSYLNCLQREVRLSTQGRTVEEQAAYDAAHAPK